MQELVEKIALLNNSSKSWSLQDYIVSWQNIHPDYKELMNQFNIYDIEMSQLAEILHYGISVRVSGPSMVLKQIKTGAFRIKDLPKSKILLDQVTDMLKCVPRLDRASNKALISSYTQFVTTHSKYNHATFIQKLKQNKDLFKLSTQDAEEFSKVFSCIYP
jgi:hypothetical protein